PPPLLEKYCAAAEKIASAALVTAQGPQALAVKVPGKDLVQAPANISNPFGKDARVLLKEGQLTTLVEIPHDGQYLLLARVFGQQAGPEPVKMAFRVDGKNVKTVTVKSVEKAPGVFDARVGLKAGSRQLGVAFLNDYYNEKHPDPKKRDRNLVVETFEV